jgi:hypothetical protein
MALTFKPRVRWPKNDLLLPAKLFDISVPRGVDAFDVRSPNIVDVAEMIRLAPNSKASSSGQLAMVNGLVTAKLTISFADPKKQWRKTPLSLRSQSPHGPWQFEFTGGDVFLDLDLAIYVAKSVDYDPKDDLSVQIFALIYEHELLHVLDEIDIVTRWLPAHVLAEPAVERHLVQRKPYVYGTASSTAMEQDFAEFLAKIIVDNMNYFWVTEKNRRARLRDDPAEYKIVQDKVDRLRTRQINRPSPK